MIKALVDSMDGNSARVLIGDEAVALSIPIKELPPHTREGMMLRVKFTLASAIPTEKESKSGESSAFISLLPTKD